MLNALTKFFNRRQKPPYQSGTNLLLLLVLSVVIGAGVAYATLGFMGTFERIVNWVYFDWSDTPSGRYTHKFDARNKLQFDFRGNSEHGLKGLKQTQDWHLFVRIYMPQFRFERVNSDFLYSF